MSLFENDRHARRFPNIRFFGDVLGLPTTPRQVVWEDDATAQQIFKEHFRWTTDEHGRRYYGPDEHHRPLMNQLAEIRNLPETRFA